MNCLLKNHRYKIEDLEIFASFGAHLDKDASKKIEHDQLIRACLKHAESSPVSIPEQITVLLALTSGLFDQVLIDQMSNAVNLDRQS